MIEGEAPQGQAAPAAGARGIDEGKLRHAPPAYLRAVGVGHDAPAGGAGARKHEVQGRAGRPGEEPH